MLWRLKEARICVVSVVAQCRGVVVRALSLPVEARGLVPLCNYLIFENEVYQ
jgi:hypothetical protein